MKLLIIGYPRSGKTTLAETQQVLMQHPYQDNRVKKISTDDLVKQYEWSAFSDKVADLLTQPGPWIIEGCSAVRGLRKYLKAGNKPDFEIVWLDKPYIPLTGKQIGFAASLSSIYKECQEIMKGQKND